MNAKCYFQMKNPTFVFKNEETNYYELSSNSMFYGTVNLWNASALHFWFLQVSDINTLINFKKKNSQSLPGN